MVKCDLDMFLTGSCVNVFVWCLCDYKWQAWFPVVRKDKSGGKRSSFSLLCKRYESLFCARMLPGALSAELISPFGWHIWDAFENAELDWFCLLVNSWWLSWRVWQVHLAKWLCNCKLMSFIFKKHKKCGSVPLRIGIWFFIFCIIFWWHHVL